MITIEQCRGARGLLGWTQQDLADASGLSKTAINNFEKRHSDIKTESLRAIRMAFESADIEFLNMDGIRKKSESIQILKGPTAMSDLMDDIAMTLENIGGEILISHVDSSLLNHISSQKIFDHIELVKRHAIRERVLCTTGTKNVLSPSDECRWIPADKTRANVKSFAYGTKVAFILWDHAMIVVIDSAEAHAAETKRFEYLWEKADIPAQNSAKSLNT
jgi:transcriptional regulator with XRE-family HTH domain